MHDFSGPQLTKSSGLNRAADTGQPIYALVMGGNGAEGPTNEYNLGDVLLLGAPEDLDGYGITAAYDASNGVKVRYHVNRFFEYCPNGLLAFMLVSRSWSLTDICGDGPLEALLLSELVDRRVDYLGIVRNPPIADFSYTFDDGVNVDALSAQAQLNSLIARLYDQGYYVSGGVVEGVLADGANPLSLPNNRGLAAENASILIGADEETLNPSNPHAEVGAFLGMVAVRQPSECVGSIQIANPPTAFVGQEAYPLTRLGKGFFTKAALTNNASWYALTEAQKTDLQTKGYIYVGKYEGLSGYFFSDSHTATSTSSDYAYIEDNRVWAAACRILRRTLLPAMKGKFETNTDGSMAASAVAYLEAKAAKAIKQGMANDLSGDPVVKLNAATFASTGAADLSLKYFRQSILRTLTGTVGATITA